MPTCPGPCNPNRYASAGFLNFAATNAGNADFLAYHCTVFHDSDGLNIRLECTGRHFNDVHTDTAFFLGKSSTNDGSTVEFLLSTYITYVAHNNNLRKADCGIVL